MRDSSKVTHLTAQLAHAAMNATGIRHGVVPLGVQATIASYSCTDEESVETPVEFMQI